MIILYSIDYNLISIVFRWRNEHKQKFMNVFHFLVDASSFMADKID